MVSWSRNLPGSPNSTLFGGKITLSMPVQTGQPLVEPDRRHLLQLHGAYVGCALPRGACNEERASGVRVRLDRCQSLVQIGQQVVDVFDAQ